MKDIRVRASRARFINLLYSVLITQLFMEAVNFEGDITILLDGYMICMLNQWMIIMSIYRRCIISDARRVNRHITGAELLSCLY